MIVWTSACQCLTVTIQCWKQWAEAFAETLISQFVPTADLIWPHLTQWPFVPKNPWNWPWFSYEPALSLNVHICFATLPRSARGTEENSFGRKKLIYRVRKKESCAGAFHPSPPLPKDFFNVSFEPNLWCYFLTLSPSMPAFVWIMFWKYWRVQPLLQDGLSVVETFLNKNDLKSLRLPRDEHYSYLTERVKSEIVNFRLK